MKILKSLRFLFVGVLKKLYLLIPSLLTDPWDIMERWFQVSPWDIIERLFKVRYEQSQFIFFWTLLVLGFAIALIWTYCELKKFKKQLKNENKLQFEFNDNSVTTKDDRLILGVNFSSSVEMIIDNLLLEYNGKQFRPLDWEPFKLSRIHNKNYTFNLSKIRAVASVDNKDAKFAVIIDKNKHESIPFNIYDLL